MGASASFCVMHARRERVASVPMACCCGGPLQRLLALRSSAARYRTWRRHTPPPPLSCRHHALPTRRRSASGFAALSPCAAAVASADRPHYPEATCPRSFLSDCRIIVMVAAVGAARCGNSRKGLREAALRRQSGSFLVGRVRRVGRAVCDRRRPLHVRLHA